MEPRHWKYFKCCRFDLVITDFVMPKLNGLKFVEQLHTLQHECPYLYNRFPLGHFRQDNTGGRGRDSSEAF